MHSRVGIVVLTLGSLAAHARLVLTNPLFYLMRNLNKCDSIDDDTHMLIYFSHSLHDIMCNRVSNLCSCDEEPALALLSIYKTLA